MDKLIKYIYYFSILCFALPSGDILNIPVKILITFGLLILFLASRLIENKPIVIDGVVKGFVLILGLLVLWACLGMVNGYDTVFMALKSFLSLLVTVLSSYLMITNHIVTGKKAMKVISFTAVIMVGFKFLCELVLMAGILDWVQFRELYLMVTGTNITTMQIPFGGMTIYRLMATNDYLPLVLIGFYLVYEKSAIWKKAAIIALLGVYTFIVYSRVAMLQYGIIVLFYIGSLLWDFVKHTTRKRMRIFTVLGAGVLAVLVLLFALKSDMIISTITTFAESMYERWFGNSAEYSDSFRVEQKIYLWEGIRKTPVVGQGLGSYIRGYLRSTVVPFSYEAEYLSFIYQFGFVGFVLIIGGTLTLFAKICFTGTKRNRMRLLVLLNFGIWAVRPLYNPQFLSSSSGMIIVAIFLAATYYSKSLDLKKVN